MNSVFGYLILFHHILQRMRVVAALQGRYLVWESWCPLKATIQRIRLLALLKFILVILICKKLRRLHFWWILCIANLTNVIFVAVELLSQTLEPYGILIGIRLVHWRKVVLLVPLLFVVAWNVYFLSRCFWQETAVVALCTYEISLLILAVLSFHFVWPIFLIDALAKIFDVSGAAIINSISNSLLALVGRQTHRLTVDLIVNKASGTRSDPLTLVPRKYIPRSLRPFLGLKRLAQFLMIERVIEVILAFINRRCQLCLSFLYLTSIVRFPSVIATILLPILAAAQRVLQLRGTWVHKLRLFVKHRSPFCRAKLMTVVRPRRLLHTVRQPILLWLMDNWHGCSGHSLSIFALRVVEIVLIHVVLVVICLAIDQLLNSAGSNLLLFAVYWSNTPLAWKHAVGGSICRRSCSCGVGARGIALGWGYMLVRMHLKRRVGVLLLTLPMMLRVCQSSFLMVEVRLLLLTALKRRVHEVHLRLFVFYLRW